jgi:hypothetical protein
MLWKPVHLGAALSVVRFGVEGEGQCWTSLPDPKRVDWNLTGAMQADHAVAGT